MWFLSWLITSTTHCLLLRDRGVLVESGLADTSEATTEVLSNDKRL